MALGEYFARLSSEMSITDTLTRHGLRPRPAQHLSPDAARLYAASLAWLLGAVTEGLDVPQHMLAQSAMTDELIAHDLWVRTDAGVEVVAHEFVQLNRMLRTNAA